MCFPIRRLALAALAGTNLFLSGRVAECQPSGGSPDVLIRRAIAAAGGRARLAAAPALEWDARAVVHVPGRDIVIKGTWRIQPPDSAIVSTWDTTQGPGSTRRLILAGTRGWIQRDSALTPMPDAVLVEERHQFYLYSLLRLLALERAGVRLSATPADSAGRPGVRVEAPGRLPVTLHFDAAARVARIETTFATDGPGPGEGQSITLTGSIEAGGVRWFRRMTILRSGKPYYELELTALRVLPALKDTLLDGPRAPYRDASLPVEARVRDLLGRMTLEEKFRQLYMTPGDLSDGRESYRDGIFGLQLLAERRAGDSSRPADAARAGRDVAGAAATAAATTARRAAEHANAVQRLFVEETRLGIPAILFEEAVHGLMQYGATVYPAAIGLAATWDTTLVARVARSIAEESRTRGVRQVLSPVINIASDVRWGRVEETYGEDPFLSSAMGLAFVRAFEGAGVVATPKHFVANVGEGGRDSYPIEWSERLLEEVHFPPFRAAIERGGARSVMAAYNSVDGVPATQNRALLMTKLRDEWKFGGVVISDQAGVGGANVLHFTSANYATSTAQAIEAGNDVIFQSSVSQAPLFREAFRTGMVSARATDSAVARVLRLKFQLGLFEHPYVDAEAAARVARDRTALSGEAGSVRSQLAREAARAAIVLLKNEARTLPLAKSLRSVAVIGTDAAEARLGGYTIGGARRVSILDGIREKLGAAGAVRYASGPGREAREVAVIPSAQLASDSGGVAVRGLKGEYFDNIALEGAPRVTRTDARVDFSWTLGGPARGIPTDWYSARWTGRLVAPASGTVRVGVEGNDGYRLWLDGKLILDDWRKRSYGLALAPVTLERGRAYDVRLEYFETTRGGHVKLVWDAGVTQRWREQLGEAVALARASDVAVVVVGIEEGEFRDRSSLRLPGHQEELIRAVAGAGKPVVVVLIGGSAVTMGDWLDRTGAVVEAWYPGEEGGRAVADVLFGDANPAGRLPITFAMAEGQLPLVYNHKPTGRGDDYLDLTGQPLFPFGHGLSYSSFEYSGLSIEPGSIGTRDSAVVRARVKNVGPLDGDEVVQLYVRDLVASTAQPVLALKGFRRVHLGVGEEREVRFTLGPGELSLLDAAMRRVVEPGEFRVLVGASSRDLRLRGTLTVR